MRNLVLRAAVASYLLAGCGHGDATGGAGSSAALTTPATPAAGPGSGAGAAEAGSAAAAAEGPGAGSQAVAPAAPPTSAAPAPPAGHDFTAAAKLLLAVGACGDGAVSIELPEALLKKHCALVHKTQADYKDNWVKKARGFFAEKVPASIPKAVVYPFAGGDLSTALTVFPDAGEITTLSLEPAGDPRTLAALAVTPEPAKPRKAGGAKKVRPNPLLEKALGTIQYELRFLYRVNFSNTLNMIGAMRAGELPTQLVFGLSALKVHGYEVVSLRYFKLGEDGGIRYLTDEDVAQAPDPLKRRASKRNELFANAELRFRKPGGPIQIYRHIQYNLDDEHLAKDPRVVKHLEAKGSIAAMTKAASYLLSWDSFSTIRNYLMKHAAWMVSDATGVAPKWGKRAGFEYETYGNFTLAHLKEGHAISPSWHNEWKSQARRELPFRFGYYDNKINNHLVIMRKKSS